MNSSRDTDSFAAAVLALLIAWLGLSAAVKLTGWPVLWGMIPTGLPAGYFLSALTLLPLLFFTGPVKGSLEATLRKSIYNDIFRRNRQYRLAACLGLCAVIFLLGWTFHSENHFLGDGWMWINSVDSPLRFEPDRPLDFFIHHVAYRLFSLAGLRDNVYAFTLLHSLLMPVFVVMAWKTAGLVSKRPLHQCAVFLFVTGTGSLQLFAGYAECYTILHLWTIFYIHAGIRHFKDTGGSRTVPRAPTVFFVLMFLSHRSGVVFASSLAWLWVMYFSGGSGTDSRVLIRNLVIVVLFSALGPAYALLTGHPATGLLLPLTAPGTLDKAAYPLFSGRHLLDLLNFLLLVCPAAVAALPPLLAGFRRLPMLKQPSFLFLLTAAAGASLLAAVIDPLLGMRDWDLLAIPAIPLGLLCGWGLLRLLENSRLRDSLLLAIGLAAFIHSAAWIRVNSDMDRGVRFLDRVKTADFHTKTGKVNLAGELKDRGYLEEALEQNRLAEGPMEDRALLNMGLIYLEMGMPDSTIELFQEKFIQYEGDIVLNSIPAITVRLSAAYDLAFEADSALKYFLIPMEHGQQYSDNDKNIWLSVIREAYEHYFELVGREPENMDAVLFFLRFYTMSEDEGKLHAIYSYHSNQELPPESWPGLLRFARICGDREYYDMMLEAAASQYPEMFSRE